MDRKYRILLVDDEKTNLDVLSRMLRDDYVLFAAKSGEAALTRAVNDLPDLILLDIVMPEMDGFEVLIELKRREETRRIPVIFITGLDSVEQEEKGLSLGAVDYITKPFHAAIVKARINSHLKIVDQVRMIEQLSGIDELTGLPNRRRFDEHLTMEWTRAKRKAMPICVIMLDVDDFKKFNDKYGHHQGDAVLQTVGKVLTECIRRPGDMAARWGGEEFTIILPDTDLTGALNIAENVRARVEGAFVPMITGGGHLHTTVSVGAECSLSPGIIDVSELVAGADKNMYIAKEHGKNRVYPAVMA